MKVISSISHTQWLALLLTTVACLILFVFSKFLIRNLIKSFLKKENLSWKVLQGRTFSTSLPLIISSLLWFAAIPFFDLPQKAYSYCYLIGKVFIIFGIIFSCYQAVDFIVLILSKKDKKFDDILSHLVEKTAKIIITVIAIIFIGEIFSLDMRNLVAGLGIGGLAFALAAKDTLANFLASYTIFFDRPFKIGDWVVIDGDIEGIVENVGIRSCHIRTFNDSLTVIPNGKLMNVAIDNYGLRRVRRLKTHIDILYSTPLEKIEKFCQEIRGYCQQSQFIEESQSHVYFHSMGESSLKILIYIFFNTKTWGEELEERHKFLKKVMELGHSMQVEFAFPTKTLHLFNHSQDKGNQTNTFS